MLVNPRVAVEVECPGLKIGKAVVRRVRVQVGYALTPEGMSSCPPVIKLREVKEGLAKELKEEAEGRERKRKWIMSGGR